jgi:sirohydrochlorin cobaltochelatase
VGGIPGLLDGGGLAVTRVTLGERPVLLAVAHGTAERAGIEELDALVSRIRALRPGLRVVLSYVDHEPPSVSSALLSLARESAPVVALPLLLVAATHSKSDIAGALQQARSLVPGFHVAYGRPLGAHPSLLEVLEARLSGAGAGPDTAVLLVSAGSADPDANAEIPRIARLLWERRGAPAPVEVAYASATSPTVPAALERLRVLGHTDVVVLPYFLAPGRFTAAVASDARAHGARMAEVLGAHDGVARAVLERYDEAIAGDIRMNCDMCMYRVPWPGKEHRVGAPQLPHTHPADA